MNLSHALLMIFTTTTLLISCGTANREDARPRPPFKRADPRIKSPALDLRTELSREKILCAGAVGGARDLLSEAKSDWKKQPSDAVSAKSLTLLDEVYADLDMLLPADISIPEIDLTECRRISHKATSELETLRPEFEALPEETTIAANMNRVLKLLEVLNAELPEPTSPGT